MLYRYLHILKLSVVLYSLWFTLRQSQYLKYCNGFDQRIARQRLGKHIPTHAPPKNMVEVFSIWSASHNSTSVVFSAWSVPRLYNGSVFADLSSCQRKRPTSTNLQLSDSNKDLVLSPRWVLYSKTD
jgi:hypothetical protein